MKKLFLLAIAIFMFSCSSDNAAQSLPCQTFVQGLKKECNDASETNCNYYVNHVTSAGLITVKVSKAVYYYYSDKLMGENPNGGVCWEGENPI